MAKDKDNYGAGSLTVLEGLDAVRKRPGMYIGTTDSQGLMHCLWEIIDNSVDEALAGVCNHIVVTLHSDGSVEVADNGRGIPVDIEPKTKLTGVEVVLTKLHAGAKFGNSSYGASGGLHGVGSSVVNALSSRLDVEVDRDGKTHHMSFHQGHPGVYTDVDPEHPSPDAPFRRTRKNRPTELEIIGKVSPKTTGTRIRYWADPEIFNDTAEFSYEQLIDRVRQTSFLVPGLKSPSSTRIFRKPAMNQSTKCWKSTILQMLQVMNRRKLPKAMNLNMTLPSTRKLRSRSRKPMLRHNLRDRSILTPVSRNSAIPVA